MKSLQDKFTLYNGYGIPCLGFGTFLIKDGEDAVQAIHSALQAGYRHIDTASSYGNHKSVGEAVRMSGIDRSEIFVTSKIWGNDQGYESTLKAFEKTLSELRFDYLDLYLIHWPRVKGKEDDWVKLNRQTWQAMETLYGDGVIKSIGVSNFKPHHILSLTEMSLTVPMVNQIEIHPGLDQDETVEFCKANRIQVEAWGPLAHGDVFNTEDMGEIARKHNKTIAQVCLRWLLQRDIISIPKSVHPERMKENADIFDFELAPHEMDYISGLKGIKGFNMDPDTTAL